MIDIPLEFISLFWGQQKWPMKIKDSIKKNNLQINFKEERFKETLEEEKNMFTREMRFLENKLSEIKKFSDYNQKTFYFEEVTLLKEYFDASFEKINSFNYKETLFKQMLTDYSEIKDLFESFDPYYKLWSQINEYDNSKQDWQFGDFLQLNYNKIDKRLIQFIRNNVNIQEKFKSDSNKVAQEMSQKFNQEVEDFQSECWIIQYLTIEVMIKKPNNWLDLFKLCEISSENLQLDQISLDLLIHLGFLNFQGIISEYSKKVEKQFALEKKYWEIIEQIKLIKLGTTDYKNGYILTSIDEIIQQIDDNINTLIFMKSSPFVKPILKKTNDLENRLYLIQETLECGMRCQRFWKYFEPIFSSDDIKKKMPIEHRKFESVDRTFKNNLSMIHAQAYVWQTIENDKLKQDFVFCNNMLDAIQKSLTDYLENKRKSFPRFYFLSDDQLLEILAQTKDPTMVQKHINKCFENINNLNFNKEELVLGIQSFEKEYIPFFRYVDVNEGEKKGQVEKWLLEIQEVMQGTLKRISNQSMKRTQSRMEWIGLYPNMTILTANMVFWTEESEKNIQDGINSLMNYLTLLDKELKDIVNQVRIEQDEILILNMQSLIVLDVHNRDIIQNLIQNNIKSTEDFDWIAQLRFYNTEASIKTEIADNDPHTIMVKCIHSVREFGFEYLGCSPRLVITPLTDLCYRTLMMAYKLVYGGSPEGPAGTGKTETVKDLSKALAMPCVVFNASDQLNYIAMKKLFKGLATSGSWCCFDEFNRMDTEVLSVVAQQISQIFNAIKQYKTKFLFDGEEINLIDTMCINVTMNPDYAGRKALPDNLRALFRTVAMISPDIYLIAMIYLYSKGFLNAALIAQKIVSASRVASEQVTLLYQLSSQYHYDWGMRSLKSVLQAAGNLKRTSKQSEEIIALQILQSVNIPKFILDDIPIFKSITTDLFPNLSYTTQLNEELMNGFKDSYIQKNLIPTQGNLDKCIQVFETSKLRTGIALIGNANCGKSTILEIIRETLFRLYMNNKQAYQNLLIQKINPKSITILQLYGFFDADTKNWSDGILPKLMREYAEDSNDNIIKWIVLDGPVDPDWVENLNTVLDDNKKLCLTSGEQIKMTSLMNIIFEVENLQNATPATVSRCGIIFVEQKNLSWRQIVDSFFKKDYPPQLDQYKLQVEDIIFYCLNATLPYIAKYGKFPMNYNEVQLVQTFINYFSYYLEPFKAEDSKVQTKFIEYSQGSIIFSLIWAIGGLLEESVRGQFHEFILNLIKGSNITEIYNLEFENEPKKLMIMFNDHMIQNMYNVCYQRKEKNWISWLGMESQKKIEGENFNNIFIPTLDSIRNNYLLRLNIAEMKHMLLIGSTGTGKTINVINELNNNYYNETYTNLITAFSGKTSCNQIQRSIEAKMTTKRRKNRFGPEDRKSKIVIFIDDINMPLLDTYGCQPAVEIIRQQLDDLGWYDLDAKQWKYLEDMIVISAMGLPTSGKNNISLRCSRHFSILYVESFSQSSLYLIFGKILNWFLTNENNPFNKNIIHLSDKIVTSTIKIYYLVKDSKEFLPTPNKSHYTFNIRDISRVFQGLTLCSPVGIKTDNDFLRVWSHECLRVFQDRMIDLEDQNTFLKILKQTLKDSFNRDWSQIKPQDHLLFTSFLPVIMNDKGELIEDVYCEINDISKLKSKCIDKLQAFNKYYPSQKMELVIFVNALEHLLRIYRIIKFPQGHGLLIGSGGSGRRSLASLCIFIIQYQFFTIDSRSWIEEIQKTLKTVGINQKKSVILLSDIQIKSDSIYEDISNLLNNGEIPNLFPIEEKAKIVEEIGQFMQVGTSNQKYQYFVNKCKENLHFILCMSPYQENFRKRIRNFPGLVNCTCIDWFLAWPQDALYSTASFGIAGMDFSSDDEEKTKKNIVNVIIQMQFSVQNLTKQYYNEYRRYYYITPSSYLEMISTFKRIFAQRQLQIDEQTNRYVQGLQKLHSTEQEVLKMQYKLEQLKPVLIEKNQQNEILLQNLQVNQDQANEKREICQKDEAECDLQKKEANELKRACEQDLSRVLPILEQASQALEKIKQEDITLIKSFTSPPPTLDLVMQAVIIALGEDSQVKWKQVDINDKSKGLIQDFWEYAKKNTLNNRLIKRIQCYREDKIRNINIKNIDKLKVICNNPDFQRDKVFKVSEPAGNLSSWIRACVETFDALLIVDPRRQKLIMAEQKLILSEQKLLEKQKALQQVLDFLKKLEDEYNQAIREKEILEQQVETVTKQLQRAQKLIMGLGQEKDSWTKKKLGYDQSRKQIVGDILLVSGIISYMGIFHLAYRDISLDNWKEALINNHIQFDQKFSLQEILLDQNTLGIWTNQHKLPNDRVSIENAIIIKNTKRTSLIIDPQQQGNIWIRQKYEKNLVTIRHTMNQQEMAFIIEQCITKGNQLLLENIEEDLDSFFDDVINLNYVKVGTQLMVNFQEKRIQYNPNYDFIITTKLMNPHYSPEICIKLTLLNFMVTQEGLQDQIMNIIIRIEEPLKYEQKEKNIVEFFENKLKQQETEDKILKMLSEASGNILDDEVLIDTLEMSKNESYEIEQKIQQQQVYREQFKLIQNFYKDVSKQAAILYFGVQDLAMIESVYQFSLEFYIDVFEKSLENMPQGKYERIIRINNSFAQRLFENIIKSLLFKDKLIFSMIICTRILLYQKNAITNQQFRFLILSGTRIKIKQPNPCSIWLTDKQWSSIEEISDTILVFKGLDKSFIAFPDQWELIFKQSECYNTDQMWPSNYSNILNIFQRLIVVKIIRPDQLVQGFQNMIVQVLGNQYLNFQPIEILQLIEESQNVKPIIFILSKGSDPTKDFEQSAIKLQMKEKYIIKSMGQGQGPGIMEAFQLCLQKGYWLFIQNCHLGISFMQKLESLYDSINSESNKDFRLWMSLKPFNEFPVSLLQKSIKVTYEPPIGIKNNMIKAYQSLNWDQVEISHNKQAVKRLVYGLCLFNAIVLERRRFGALGWNIMYEFSITDLLISVEQAILLLEANAAIQWDALQYLIAETNYGGRIVDKQDRKLLQIILKQFLSYRVLHIDYEYFPENKKYNYPGDGTFRETLMHIGNYPHFDHPSIFGLHSNANIKVAILNAEDICTTFQGLLAQNSSEEFGSLEQQTKMKVIQYLELMPDQFNLEMVVSKFPVSYFQSMNIFLQQEVEKYNRLTKLMKSNFQNLVKALDGIIPFQQEIEKLNIALSDNNIPDTWKAISYKSNRKLSSWIQDLIQRLNYFQGWISKGQPSKFWISGFFFTQSFFTAILQNFSRKYPIDQIQFYYLASNSKGQFFHKKPQEKDENNEENLEEFQQEDGCVIYGLYLDGCKWDLEKNHLSEQDESVLNVQMTDICCIPDLEKNIDRRVQSYLCPVYKTLERKGDLTSTGHSTNYICSIDLSIANGCDPSIWNRRGVAMVCQLNE